MREQSELVYQLKGQNSFLLQALQEIYDTWLGHKDKKIMLDALLHITDVSREALYKAKQQ